MNATKLMVTLSCLLAILLLVCGHALGARGIHFENHPVSMAAGVVDTPPFKMRVEGLCPLFAERELVSKIADIPAGEHVLVTEKFNMDRGNKTVILSVKYLDNRGKEYTGWVYGTIRITLSD